MQEKMIRTLFIIICLVFFCVRICIPFNRCFKGRLLLGIGKDLNIIAKQVRLLVDS